MRSLIALVSGLVFGLGLIAGGMTDPAKIKGFLDLFGAWDPSLALVMGGAIAIAVLAFAAARRRTLSWSGDRMEIPTSTVIDRRLIVGGLLFGVGWGIAGFSRPCARGHGQWGRIGGFVRRRDGRRHGLS